VERSRRAARSLPLGAPEPGPRRPARVLYTIPNFQTAGSGRAMVNVISRIDRARFEPTVCVSRRGDGPLERELADLGVDVFEAPFTVDASDRAQLLPRLWSTARAFRPMGFDLWHSYHYLDDYTEPLVARLAGSRWVYTKKNMSWNRRWVVRSLLASGIGAQNTDMLRRFFPRPPLRRRARLIPPGIEPEAWAGAAPIGMRIDLGLDATTPVVACVAHLNPVKRHGVVIRAAAAAPGVHLVLAGRSDDAAYRAELDGLVAELGVGDRVHFVGPIADVAGLLAEVDVVVLPTGLPGEGCPVALIEAFAAGRAVVATDVSGNRDLVSDGATGLLVPPDDHAAMGAAFTRLATAPDLRARLGEAGRRRVDARHRLAREVAAYESLYGDVLGWPSG
jgi:glycosyltransferase involved in cell wall biosynthesis